MYYRRKSSSSGMGLWLLVGIAVGAAACCGVCGMCAMPTRRKIRRRLMHAADAVSDAIDNMYSAIK